MICSSLASSVLFLLLDMLDDFDFLRGSEERFLLCTLFPLQTNVIGSMSDYFGFFML